MVAIIRGFKIIGPNKSTLFISDINKWDVWAKNIVNEIEHVDYAFLDATFYDGNEINNRDIKDFPHPFIIESLEKYQELSTDDKNKIVFIHFNHINPVINRESRDAKLVLEKGFHLAKIHDVYNL